MVGLVSFCLQGRDLATQSLFIGNTPAQDSPGRHCSISAMLSQLPKMKLQAFAYSPSLLGLEGRGKLVWVLRLAPPGSSRTWVSFIGQDLLSEVHGTDVRSASPPGARTA